MTPKAALEKALTDVRVERARQDAKWGADRSQPDAIWLAILTEEVGESAEEVLALDWADGDPKAQRMIRTNRLRAELIQVAAVAVAWVEAIDDDR